MSVHGKQVRVFSGISASSLRSERPSVATLVEHMYTRVHSSLHTYIDESLVSTAENQKGPTRRFRRGSCSLVVLSRGSTYAVGSHLACSRADAKVSDRTRSVR